MEERRLILEPFYLYPLEGDMLKYFVGREKELDYVIKTITMSNGEILGVVGAVGSGKTSFLNMVRERYWNKVGRSATKVEIRTAKSLLGGYVPNKSVELLLVDDVAYLDDRQAMEFYAKIYDISAKWRMNIVFTDKTHRSRDAERRRSWVITGRLLRMDLRTEDVVSLMKERFRRGGIEEVFTDDALEMIALRTGSNLREFLKYSKEVYVEHEGRGKIGKEEVVEIIKRVDTDLIENMDEVSRAIISVLLKKSSEKGGLNATMLLKYVRDELERNVSSSTLYDNLRYLLEDRFVIARRMGKDTIYISIHKILGIHIEIEEPNHNFEMAF